MGGEFVLAIDSGTTSTRALLFDRDGLVRSSAAAPVRQSYPQPGWVDHDAAEIWKSTRRVMGEALAAAGVRAGQVAAIGITNQRETTVVWDRTTGQPLAPAICWQSRQSAPLVEAIAGRGMTGRYRKQTGLVPDAYFSATKLALLLEETPGLRERAEAGDALFGTIDSWLLWNLTGGNAHLTDLTNASRTMLFDIHRLAWSTELLADLAIPAVMLPRVQPSGGLFGTAEVDGARIPVGGMAGDQQAALFGQACFSPGQVKVTYGTGAFLLMETGPEAVESPSGLLATLTAQAGDSPDYALEGSVFVAGAAVGWLRDGLGVIDAAGEIEALARTVGDSGGVTFVPALTGLGAPWWDADARGAIVGITRGTTRAHLARATLEAIAQQVADVAEAMQADSGIAPIEIRADGGAAANDLLLQVQADLLGIPVVRPTMLETTARGAAWLAGLTVGTWAGRDELAAAWAPDARFKPSITDTERASQRDRWREAVGKTRR